MGTRARRKQARGSDVEAVHSAYRQAGCRLITTNTIGGTRSMLDRHGLGDQVSNRNRKTAALAREEAGSDGFVYGDAGPCGDFLLIAFFEKRAR